MTEQQLAKHYGLDIEDSECMDTASQLWQLGSPDYYVSCKTPDDFEQAEHQLHYLVSELYGCANSGLSSLVERALATSSLMQRLRHSMEYYYQQWAEETLLYDLEKKYHYLLEQDVLLQKILNGEAGIPEILQLLVRHQKQSTDKSYSLPAFIQHLREWFVKTQFDASLVGIDAALIRQIPELSELYSSSLLDRTGLYGSPRLELSSLLHKLEALWQQAERAEPERDELLHSMLQQPAYGRFYE